MKFIKKQYQNSRRFLKKSKTIGFFIALILCIGVSFSILQRLQILKEQENKSMHKTLNTVVENINKCLNSSYTATLTLALTINDDGIPENFESISSQLLASNNCIDVLQLVPNGIIKYIFPMQGNEAAMNVNLLKDKLNRREALKSLVYKKMVFAGPLPLRQGGIGIVGRLPVYKKNKFWGFSAVVIRMDTLLKMSGINAIDTNKYYFQFSKKNPNTQREEYFIPSKHDLSENYHISTLIPEGNWKLYLIAKKRHVYYSELILPSILGFTLAIVLGAFVTILVKKPKRLQKLVLLQATKLLNSEIKFKTIFDQAPLGIALVNDDTGNFLEINRKFCDLIGFSQQEMKLRNLQSITHAHDFKKNEATREKFRNGEIDGYSVEKRYITKSGSIAWVNLIVSALSKTDENPNTSIIIVEDITLHKQILDDLKKSEKQFRSLFKNSPIPLWEVDFSAVKNYLEELNLMQKEPKTVSAYFSEYPEVVKKCFSLIKIIAVNYKCLQLLNISSKKLLEEYLDDINKLESVNNIIKLFIAITQGEHQLSYESKIKNTKGKSIDIHFRWNVIRGYEESLERIIVSTEDITFRKKNEKLIINSRQKIESLVNTIDGIVWECEIDTFSFTFISKKVEQILGYSAEEWMNSNDFWQNHIHPADKDRVIEYFLSDKDEKYNNDIEYRMIAKNGEYVWLRDMVNVVFESGKAAYFRGIMIDITKAKNVEKDLNTSFNLVTKQNERLLNFSYIISHNLRSHTSNIASIISLIEVSEEEEEKEQLIQLLGTVSNLLNETMHHLNEVINIRTNITLFTEVVNLHDYIENTLKFFSNKIITNDVTVSNFVPHDVLVNYNPAYLESILFNIISNAIRYGHPNRKTHITIEWIIDKDKKILKISDNGIGIDLSKNGDKIFGMYKTFSNNPDSKGVGLFITKNQIEAMGGTITIESQPNVGTIFNIYIL